MADQGVLRRRASFLADEKNRARLKLLVAGLPFGGL
jgi:hypothetical protein